jgi:hypothetical protein
VERNAITADIGANPLGDELMTEKKPLFQRLKEKVRALKKSGRGSIGIGLLFLVVLVISSTALLVFDVVRASYSANNLVSTADDYSTSGYNSALEWQKFKKELAAEVSKCETDWGYTIENKSSAYPKGKVTVPEGAPISAFSDEYLVIGKYDIDSLQPSVMEDAIGYQFPFFCTSSDSISVSVGQVTYTSDEGVHMMTTNLFDVRYVGDSNSDFNSTSGRTYLVLNTQFLYTLDKTAKDDVDAVHSPGYNSYQIGGNSAYPADECAAGKFNKNIVYNKANISFDGSTFSDYTLTRVVHSTDEDNYSFENLLVDTSDYSKAEQLAHDYCVSSYQEKTGPFDIYVIDGMDKYERTVYIQNLSYSLPSSNRTIFSKGWTSAMTAEYIDVYKYKDGVKIETPVGKDWRPTSVIGSFSDTTSSLTIPTIIQESQLPCCSIVSTFLGSKIQFDAINKEDWLFKNVKMNMSGIDKWYEWTEGFWTNGKGNNVNDLVDTFHIVREAYKDKFHDVLFNNNCKNLAFFSQPAEAVNQVSSKYEDYHEGLWNRYDASSRLLMFSFFDFADKNFNKQISEIYGIDVYAASANYKNVSLNGHIVSQRVGVKGGYNRDFVCMHEDYIADNYSQYNYCNDSAGNADFTHTESGAWQPARMCGRTDELDDNILKTLGYTDAEILKVKSKRFYMVVPGMTTPDEDVYDWDRLKTFEKTKTSIFHESAADLYFNSDIMAFTYTMNNSIKRNQINASLVDYAKFSSTISSGGQTNSKASDGGRIWSDDTTTTEQFRGCLSDDGNTCLDTPSCKNCLITDSAQVKGTDYVWWLVVGLVAALCVVVAFFSVRAIVKGVQFFRQGGEKAANTHRAVQRVFGRKKSEKPEKPSKGSSGPGGNKK